MQGTLEEAIEADLLLHVIDAAAPDVVNQRATVYRVLRELGVSDSQLRSRVVEVWNKADLLEAPDALGPLSAVAHVAACNPRQPQDDAERTTDFFVSPADAVQQTHASASVQMAESDPVRDPHQSTSTIPSAPQAAAEALIAAAGDGQPDASAEKADAGADAVQPSAAASGCDSPHTDAKGDRPCAAVVSTSALSGTGLDELLDVLDRKLALKLGTQELADQTSYLGPRLLSSSLFSRPGRKTKLHR